MEVVKVLHIVPNMQAGGLETLIMNIMRNIDRNKIQFDFIVHYKEKRFYDDEIIKLGGKIYRFSLRNDHNLVKYIWQLNKFFREHKEYKIIHCHMESIGFLVFLIAKVYGVKVRVAHSHNIKTEDTIKGKVKYIISRPFKYLATNCFACSDEAGDYLFKNKDYTVLPNAIELKKFEFSESKRRKIRNELNISDDTMVVGHIGRFCRQKNHLQLIDIFYDYLKVVPDSKLVLVGEGEELERVVNKCDGLNISEKVIFLNNRKDTDFLYSAFDLFLFPSLFEGLGIVLIEAQVSGLKCYTTKCLVPATACISDNIEYIGLKDNWVKRLVDNNNYCRTEVLFNSNKDNFDIDIISKRLEDFYISEYYRD